MAADRRYGSEVNELVPAGAILPFAGSSAPSNWLLCDGSVVLRSQYSTLFAAIGTSFNTGGETALQFRVPDLRGRMPLGLDNMGGISAHRVGDSEADSVGGNGGEDIHSLTSSETGSHTHPIVDIGHSHSTSGGSHTHAINDPPHTHTGSAPHTHTITDPSHSHLMWQTGANAAYAFAANGQATPTGSKITVPAFTGITIDTASATLSVNAGATGISAAVTTPSISLNNSPTGVATAAGGGGNAHNNMPPFLSLNYIIKI